MGKSASDGIVFTVSDAQVLTLENFEWSGSARYSVHNRHNYHALTEYTGMDPDKITFDMTMLVEHGVNPMDQVTKIWTYEREGIALALCIGEKIYGKYRWNITSHSMKAKYTDKHGNVAGAVVSVTLQEYLSK
jgi:phage protein U